MTLTTVLGSIRVSLIAPFLFASFIRFALYFPLRFFSVCVLFVSSRRSRARAQFRRRIISSMRYGTSSSSFLVLESLRPGHAYRRYQHRRIYASRVRPVVVK